MCERLSWYDLADGTRIGPLTTYDLFDTEQGRDLRKQFTSHDDWFGHAALAWFYKRTTKIRGAAARECTDFSSPANFPPEIAADIRAGRFIDVTDRRLLNAGAYFEWSATWPVLSQALAQLDDARAYAARAAAATNATNAVAYAARTAFLAADAAHARWSEAYLADLNNGSPAQRAFWALFADPTNRSDAWK